MKVKELMDLLAAEDPELEVVREYDGNFEPVKLITTPLYRDTDGDYGTYAYQADTPIETVVIIQSGNYVHPLTHYTPPDPNRKSVLHGQIVALEMERMIPKIQNMFDRDDIFFEGKKK